MHEVVQDTVGNLACSRETEGINQAISPAPCSGLQGINLCSVGGSQLGCLPGLLPGALSYSLPTSAQSTGEYRQH